MAWEVECVLRFEGALPTTEEIEELLECIVQEWVPEDV